jgi:hypothetical protein
MNPLQTIISRSLERVISGEGITALSDSVVDSSVRVVFHLLDSYLSGTEPLSAYLESVFAGLSRAEDELVATLEPALRQAIWATLSMLRQEKRRRAKASQIQDSPAAPSPNTNQAPLPRPTP